MKKTICILFVLFFCAKNIHAQTLHIIDSLAKVEQACLDEGRGMHGCVSLFADQMDSLLKIVYKKLYRKSNDAQKAALKKDQQLWFKKKDALLKRQRAEADEKRKKGEWDKLEDLVMFEEAVGLLEERVESLVKKLNSH